MSTPAGSAPPPALRDPADVPSKTLATWIALIAGSVGLHHLYLGGRQRWLALLYPGPTVAGLVGVWRMRTLGVDDHLSWLLIPWLGLTISIGMLCAIVIGLTTDERWAQLYAGDPAAPVTLTPYHEDDPPPPGTVRTGWGPVLGAIVALAIGGAVLMGTIAFSVEKSFDMLRDDTPQTTRQA
jgi:hypothetical protein